MAINQERQRADSESDQDNLFAAKGSVDLIAGTFYTKCGTPYIVFMFKFAEAEKPKRVRAIAFGHELLDQINQALHFGNEILMSGDKIFQRRIRLNRARGDYDRRKAIIVKTISIPTQPLIPE